jgi:hypothetical protein
MDTGFKVCGTVESAGTWANFTTTRINTQDASRASTSDTAFDAGVVSDHAFGLPGGATIKGIEVTCYMGADATRTMTARVSLSYYDGAHYTAPLAEQTVTAGGGGVLYATKTFGSATELWGRNWTAAELGAGVFRLKFEGKTTGDNCYLDYIAVKVYYDVAGFLAIL